AVSVTPVDLGSGWAGIGARTSTTTSGILVVDAGRQRELRSRAAAAKVAAELSGSPLDRASNQISTPHATAAPPSAKARLRQRYRSSSVLMMMPWPSAAGNGVSPRTTIAGAGGTVRAALAEARSGALRAPGRAGTGVTRLRCAATGGGEG